MSNPAVILLSKKIDSKSKFVVEDNIGESIHLHYNDLRFDLTTNDFLELEFPLANSLERLINIDNFKLKYFDPSFIKSISDLLPDLKKVEFEKININKLIVQTKGIFGFPCLGSVYKSRVFKALMGNPEENNSYKQVNNLNKSNQDRVNDVLRIIKEKGYPFDNRYIVLFNNQNIIRDGQHRASSLIYTGFTGNLTIIRLYFSNNNYNISKYPWLEYIKKGVKFFVKKNVIRIYITLKKVIRS